MSKDSLSQEAAARAEAARIDPDIMAMALRMQRKDRPYVVELEDEVGRSFYRVTQEGPSRVLYINVAHPFFTQMYMAEGSTRGFRDALEVFLWCLGTSELEATDADRQLYEQERHRWSQNLAHSLPILAQIWGD